MKKPGRMVGVGDFGVPVGQHHPKAKLTDEQIDRIRDLHELEGYGFKRLAAMFDTPRGTIRYICTYRRRVTSVVQWRRAKMATVATTEDAT